MSWNSGAGRVSGYITRVAASKIKFKVYTAHAGAEEPVASCCEQL